MLNWRFIFTFVLININLITADENLKLLFVQILYRHGDRAPIQLYQTDPNPATSWPEGLGMLTLLGRKQHYSLGKFFRDTYKDFISSSPLEINVISSDCDRCLESAETNLASFYEPDGIWKFENIKWQPIPIHYIPADEDRYLETDSICPRAEAEKDRVKNSPEGKKFIAQHKEMFDFLTNHSGDPITEWQSASYLHDVLFIEKRYNLTIPKWADTYWDELKEVSDLSFFWTFNSPLLHRLRAGPLLHRIIHKMQDKINGTTPNLKFQIYSAHDTNVAVVLNALNLFNMKQPPYCSSLMFELYSGVSDTYFVRLLFLNSTEPEKGDLTPHILVFPGCTEYCPLEFFINYTRHLMPTNWEKECQLSKSFVEKVRDEEVVIGVIFIVVVFIMITMSFVAVWKMYKARKDRYAYHLMSMNYN